MESRQANGIICYAPDSKKELIDFAFQNRAILIAINAEKILNATDETKLIINRNIGYPDGTGAVLVLKKKGCKNVIKIPGCELWLEIISLHQKSKSFYLIGGKENVIQETVKQLKMEFPLINIVNYRNGYFQDEKEKNELYQDIIDKQPNVVFVAMGSPKQELLMEELYQRHQAVYQGLGGSFDIYTKVLKRAPKWWLRNNLEWAYRLLKEPRRIKRQLNLIKFLWKLKTGKL